MLWTVCPHLPKWKICADIYIQACTCTVICAQKYRKYRQVRAQITVLEYPLRGATAKSGANFKKNRPAIFVLKERTIKVRSQ